MIRTRIIPALLLRHECLVKTTKFKKFTYVGDPVNTVRIFNELEVDELIILDIAASSENTTPKYNLLTEIASECFMPLGYGGGIDSYDKAKAIFDIGFEKIVLNSSAVKNPNLINQISMQYGSQAVIVSIDVKNSLLRTKKVYTRSGTYNTNLDPVKWAKEVEKRGAGEILLTSINREGTWSGFDIDLVRSVADQINIPVIAHGGAGTVNDIEEVLKEGKASAVALGSLVVYQKQGMGILINFPEKFTKKIGYGY